MGEEQWIEERAMDHEDSKSGCATLRPLPAGPKRRLSTRAGRDWFAAFGENTREPCWTTRGARGAPDVVPALR